MGAEDGLNGRFVNLPYGGDGGGRTIITTAGHCTCKRGGKPAPSDGDAAASEGPSGRPVPTGCGGWFERAIRDGIMV